MSKQLAGSAQKCFEHFISTADTATKAEFSRFMNVPRSTESGWLKGKFPIGQNLVRLWYYLEHLGYAIDEIAGLHTPIQAAGRLLAFRIVTLEDLLAVFKFKESQAYAVLLGKSGTSFDRLEALRAYCESLEPKLRVAIQKSAAEVRTPQEAAPAQAREKPDSALSGSFEILIESARLQSRSLILLLRQLRSSHNDSHLRAALSKHGELPALMSTCKAIMEEHRGTSKKESKTTCCAR